MPRAAQDPGENDQMIPREKDEPNLTFTGAPAVQVDVNVNFGGGYRMQNSSVNAPASTIKWPKIPKIVDGAGNNANPESNIIANPESNITDIPVDAFSTAAVPAVYSPAVYSTAARPAVYSTADRPAIAQ